MVATDAVTAIQFTLARQVAVAHEVLLASFGSPLEAELARVFLESRSISCSVTDAIHVAGSPFESGFGRPLSSVVGGVRVYVDAFDAERARAALEEYGNTLKDSTPPRETDDQVIARARRAFYTSAVLPGIMNLVSLWLLRRVNYSRLEPSARFQFWLTVILNIGALGLIAYFISSWILPAQGVAPAG